MGNETRGTAGPDPEPLPGPERMRRAVADYVASLHGAYVRAARLLPPAVQGRLALMAVRDFSVAAVGVRHLHLVATTERLEGPSGREAEIRGEAPPLGWTLRFYDPVVIPALGLLDESSGPALDEVRSLLGVRTFLYHLTLQPSSQLGEHHAGHAGTGLANAHAAAAREFEAIRRAAPGRERLVEEMEGAAIAGLLHAQALLATAIAPDDEEVADAARREPPDPQGLRRAVLRAVRGASPAGVTGD